MTRFQQSVVINRPPEQVFAFVSDLENDPQWTPGAVMRRTSEGPLGVGTTFQQHDRFMGRRMDLWSCPGSVDTVVRPRMLLLGGAARRRRVDGSRESSGGVGGCRRPR
jgi:uncharacterized protein YndB with AHSA1/START domain